MGHDTQVGSLEGQGEEGSAVRISIAPNPSHLEYVGPVVLGMVRAEQTRLQDHSRRRVMGLLIHGDAAFAGLGIVAECFQLADVPGEQKLVTSSLLSRAHCKSAVPCFNSVWHAMLHTCMTDVVPHLQCSGNVTSDDLCCFESALTCGSQCVCESKEA